MPRPLAIRPTSIPCACGAEVAVKRDGPLPTRCPDCVRIDQIERLLLQVVDGVSDRLVTRVARSLNAARMRLLRRHGLGPRDKRRKGAEGEG